VWGFLGAFCVASAMLTATACSAATIQPIKGDVSINRGLGFQKLDGVVEAREGDVVMVSPDGSATVSYADGCKVRLEPGVVMTIVPLSPCASGSHAQDQHQNRFFNPEGAALLAALAGFTGLITYEILRTAHPPASP
jgi:hypothetical protein